MVMIERGFRLHVSSGLWRGRFLEFFLTLFKEDGKEYLLRPNQDGGWEEPVWIHANNSMNLPSSFSLDPATAQTLFDSLYQIGYRPTMGTDDPGAINQHLQDMRAIAFNKLNIPQPGKSQ